MLPRIRNVASRHSRGLAGLLVVPGFLFCLAAGVAGGSEAVHLGLVADPAAVESYHFGSEAMLGEGGWWFQSRLTYVLESIGLTLFSVLALWLFIRGVRTVRLFPIGAGYAVVCLLLWHVW